MTGGAGYIGSHVLLGCLEAGHGVVVLGNFSNSSPEAISRAEALTERRVKICRGDVRDFALRRSVFSEFPFDAVLHFAGLKAVGESVTRPLEYDDVNVCGSVALARAMTEAGVFRLVFSSTASVYGHQADMPLTEESALGQAASPYGRSERLVEQVFRDVAASDPRWSIGVLRYFRYFNPIGAHSSGRMGEDPRGEPANLVPYAMQVAVGQRSELKVFGADYPTPDGTGIRDYIHIMDLADGHLAAIERVANKTKSSIGCRIWNLGTGRGHSVLEVIGSLERVIGGPLPYRLVGRRPGDAAQCWADPRRAESELGWKAERNLDEMLADHWRWQSNNPHGYGDGSL